MFRLTLAYLLIIIFAYCSACIAQTSSRPGQHPRLYFNSKKLKELRSLRQEKLHKRILKNIVQSADWCLTKTPRTEWIAPVSPDPIYLNLYDRFYGMMQDTAIMEHLSFAYAYTGNKKYLKAAREWTLSGCRVWKREADGEPDASKAYAVTRVLKGVSTAYDILYNDLTVDERKEISGMLAEVGHKYYQWYLDNPTMGTIQQGKHHASVEVTSFGITALALMGDEPEASKWVDLMVDKFTHSLLPNAIEPSGAQIEGATFWASTMQYRLMFMDALRNVTGRDLFVSYEKNMDARYALALIANGKDKQGWDENSASVMFHPSYGQINYFAPVLLCLAKNYKRSEYQALALWDKTLGTLQNTRYITPNDIQLLFSLGGYTYAWCDENISSKISRDVPLSFIFPEVNEACLRSSYRQDDITAGIHKGLIEVHAGRMPVVVEIGKSTGEMAPAGELKLIDDGRVAVITSNGSADLVFDNQSLKLNRPNKLTLNRNGNNQLTFWCKSMPVREGNMLKWKNSNVTVNIIKGEIASIEPEGQVDQVIVGLGKLRCIDPMPMKYPLMSLKPVDGELTIEITK